MIILRFIGDIDTAISKHRYATTSASTRSFLCFVHGVCFFYFNPQTLVIFDHFIGIRF